MIRPSCLRQTAFSISQARGRAIGLAILVALLPGGAAAHERWFTPEGPYWKPVWSDLFALPVLLALLSGAGAVALLAAVQHKVDDPLWPRPPFFQRLEPAASAILGVQTAIAIIFAASRLDLFAPNIHLPENALGVAIAGVAIVAAFSFITGVLTRWGAIAIIGLFILSFTVTTWYEALEQSLIVGIALYLVATGRGVVRVDDQQDEDQSIVTDRLRPHALTILRLSAGITVLVLAFTEKLLAVELGEAFLREYPRFNFMEELGFAWFTDHRFVYAAGIVEATAGFALLSGYLTRVTIVALWIPFNIGIAFLPPQELIGHLPILSTMYVLLVQGAEGIPAPAAAPPDVIPTRREGPSGASPGAAAPVSPGM
jgi:uncharacterized membrane protein YphA (DoxX/SURF4 family)